MYASFPSGPRSLFTVVAVALYQTVPNRQVPTMRRLRLRHDKHRVQRAEDNRIGMVCEGFSWNVFQVLTEDSLDLGDGQRVLLCGVVRVNQPLGYGVVKMRAG